MQTRLFHRGPRSSNEQVTCNRDQGGEGERKQDSNQAEQYPSQIDQAQQKVHNQQAQAVAPSHPPVSLKCLKAVAVTVQNQHRPKSRGPNNDVTNKQEGRHCQDDDGQDQHRTVLSCDSNDAHRDQ